MRPDVGRIRYFWLSRCGAEIPPTDDFGSAVVFEAASDGEQGVGIGLQPAASHPTKKWDAPPKKPKRRKTTRPNPINHLRTQRIGLRTVARMLNPYMTLTGCHMPLYFHPHWNGGRNRMRAGGRCARLAVRDKGSTGGSIEDALDQLPAIFRHVRDTAPRDARIMASF